MKNNSRKKIEIVGRNVEVVLFTNTHSLLYKEDHHIPEEEKKLSIPEEEGNTLEELIHSKVLSSTLLQEKILNYCNAIRKENELDPIEDIWQDLEIKKMAVMKEENPYCKYYGKIKISLLGEVPETDPEHGISITFVGQKIIGIGQNQDFSKIYPFRYHQEPLKTGAFHNDQSVICDCCNEETDVYYDGPFYSIEDIDYLCPSCIGSGEAIEKFQDLELTGDTDQKLEGPTAEEKKRELMCTPGYKGWQQEVWLTHCNDYCEFVGHVGWEELQKEVYDFPHEKDRKKVPIIDLIEKSDVELDWISREELSERLVNNGSMQGYLFKCLHCGKYRLHIDMD